MSYIESIPWWVLTLYIAPTALCLFGYGWRTIAGVREDIRRRNELPKHYFPVVTVGGVLVLIFISLVPAFNILALAFDLCEGLLDRLSKALDVPLVKPRSEQ